MEVFSNYVDSYEKTHIYIYIYIYLIMGVSDETWLMRDGVRFLVEIIEGVAGGSMKT